MPDYLTFGFGHSVPKTKYGQQAIAPAYISILQEGVLELGVVFLAQSFSRVATLSAGEYQTYSNFCDGRGDDRLAHIQWAYEMAMKIMATADEQENGAQRGKGLVTLRES